MIEMTTTTKTNDDEDEDGDGLGWRRLRWMATLTDSLSKPLSILLSDLILHFRVG